MKKLFTLPLVFTLILTTLSIQAQNMEGSWERTEKKEGKAIKYVLLFSGNYFTWTAFSAKDGAFIATKGGSYKVSKNKLIFTFEFNLLDSIAVGKSVTHDMEFENWTLVLDKKEKWKLQDKGATSPLQGAWLISGRMRDGKIAKRDTNRPRKTMKLLTATRFQWIAYNTETKQFMGTGGGTYTAEKGKYTENIGFFSRDDSRVGASLAFKFEVKDGDWHHSGKSSKGKPLYEIWSKRK